MVGELVPTDDFEDRVNAVIDAVNSNDSSALKSLIESDQRLLNAKVQNGTRTLIQMIAEKVVWHRPEQHNMARYLAERGAEYDIFTAARAGLLDHVRKLIGKPPIWFLRATATGIRQYSTRLSSMEPAKRVRL